MIRDSGAITVKHALAALAGIAVGLPVLAALASRPDGQPAGGLPARYVPWARVGHRVPTAFADQRAPERRPAARRPLASRSGRTPPAPSTQTVLRGPLAFPYHRPGPTAGRGPGPTADSGPGPTAYRDSEQAAPRGADRTAAQEPGRAPSRPPAGTPTDEGAGRPVDLELSIAAPPTVRPGGRFSYSVRLTNHGPGTPGPITVRSALPPGTVRTGAWLPTGVDGYTGAGEAALVVRRLGPGRSLAARFDVRVLPETRGELVARGRITAIGGVPDHIPEDDTAQVSTVVRPR
ncbi:hypothetical protein NE236_32020 [Actinoallomurus purpureus]|uniref:hypothetical protein n=1 Tax=Actinoallomurus purpureus TaxID=478114 RepID=UPI00209286C2|nr:hypothetical protein [Actinoallomurus purpureus]MCO6009609.1 hypothetical protein [Actinoallomurus purpureus]